jgi:anti-sigma regulatory factor (Ser/Thr protein kinase)
VTAMTFPGGTPAGIHWLARPQTGRPAGRAQVNGRRLTAGDPAERDPSARGARGRYKEEQAVPDFSQWPLRSHLVLGALPGAVPCARLHARQVLWEWGLQVLTDPAELVVSELVTNGVHATEGLTGSRYAGRWAPGTPPVRLWLHGHQQRIAIQVWDANNQLPARQPADPAAESGRGLLLVESLTETCGSYRPRQSSGKVVWAVLR